MTKKKKIVYTILLGIVTLANLYMSIRFFASIFTYIDTIKFLRSEGLTTNATTYLYTRAIIENSFLTIFSLLNLAMSFVFVVYLWRSGLKDKN